MNHETLEQQTAPESTRGLFDAPEVTKEMIGRYTLVNDTK
jgi:hypothetical protein